jgi:uncharacterized YigZ family protein
VTRPSDNDQYAVPARAARAELRVRGSRFAALVAPVEDESAVDARLAACRRTHHDATHVAFAYRLRSGRYRASDAREPAGTAGRPILALLDAAGLVDVLAVVARWFGGTKLGTAGLARAYADAVRPALAAAGVETRYERETLEVACPLDRVALVKRLVAPPHVALVAETFGATARFTLAVRRSRVAEIEARLAAARVDVRR